MAYIRGNQKTKIMNPQSTPRRLPRFTLILIAWLLLSAGARSETYTYSTNFVTQGGTTLLSKFNPSAGILLEASFKFSAFFSGWEMFYNGSATPLQITEPFTMGINLYGPFVGAASFGSGVVSGIVPPNSSAAVPASAPGSTSYGPVDTVSAISPDPYSFTSICTAVDEHHQWVSGNFYCSLEFTYTYAVPEPSSAALLGSALTGAALLACRRSRPFTKGRLVTPTRNRAWFQ